MLTIAIFFCINEIKNINRIYSNSNYVNRNININIRKNINPDNRNISNDDYSNIISNNSVKNSNNNSRD